jgi:hypothetical protein
MPPLSFYIPVHPLLNSIPGHFLEFIYQASDHIETILPEGSLVDIDTCPGE